MDVRLKDEVEPTLRERGRREGGKGEIVGSKVQVKGNKNHSSGFVCFAFFSDKGLLIDTFWFSIPQGCVSGVLMCGAGRCVRALLHSR